VHERIAINGLCFFGSPLSEVAGYWSEMRPHRVSFTCMLLDDVPAAHAVVKDGGYQVETIVSPFMFGHLDPREETWLEPRARLSGMLQTAATLGARSVYLTTGGHGTLTWEEAADCFCRAIAPCVEQAEAAGVALLVENASPLRANLHIAHSLRDTVLLAEMAGIGVNIDIHNCWTEAGLRQSIERAMPRCRLVQVSDYVYGDLSTPSRAVPGDGAIPLRRILDWALSAGYSGGFDFELLGPRIDEEGHLEAARRAAENMSEMLDSLGA
jgi:sugar phosphate isomerase/epimerase